jgi:DNA-binding MarR family transcriptional regulator
MAVDDIPGAVRGTDRLGFLLARHGAIANGRIQDAFGVTGLAPRQGITLMHLAKTGRLSQQALIEALGVDPSVLVAILNDLERGGLAERRRDPADRRRHIVEITARGSATLSNVEDALAAMEEELFADLDRDELTRLRELLARIRTTPGDPACTETDP